MENNELTKLGRVWLAVLISLCYSYIAGKLIPKGVLRLVALLPVFVLFLLLPLNLTSLHFIGFTSFFVSWLANFKLLMFVWDRGPLVFEHSSLRSFLAVACLPIKISQHPIQVSNTKNKTLVYYAIKGFILGLVVSGYQFSGHIHPAMLWFLYCLHTYLSLDILLAIIAAAVKATSHMELEPQFEKPHLSTSVQNFWGRRWNLMSSAILRAAVYEPLLPLCTSVTGRRWASPPAVIGTFAVSAAIHELIFYHLGRLRPTWKITCFFLLHGLTVSFEIVVKKKWGTKFRVHGLVSRPVTMAYLLATVFWLFVPQLVRFDAKVRALQEYSAALAFVKHIFGVASSDMHVM